MYPISQERFMARVIDTYDIELHSSLPDTIESYRTTPMWLGNGWFQLDDHHPRILSITTPCRHWGVLVYFLNGDTAKPYMTLHGANIAVWDDFPVEVQWQLWKTLNRFYRPDSDMHPENLTLHTLHFLKDNGTLSKRKCDKIEPALKRWFYRMCPVYQPPM